jgi:hypothetical protein
MNLAATSGLPSHFYDDLTASAQAAFDNLQSAAKARDLSRSVADLSGSFNKKVIGSATYWYYQQKDPDGKTSQVYLGRESPQILELIQVRKSPDRIESAAQLARLSSAAIALGAASIVPKHGKMIRRLAENGFFRAGGVLVGTHAFLAYQNYLGIRWGDGNQTMDLDFAHPGKNIALAMPNVMRVDVSTALESLQMGFLPVQGQARFRKNDEPDFDIDFLTSKRSDDDAPIPNERLGVTLQPLKFMELAFEHSFQTVLLLSDGPLVVTVPRPEYFAFHKIIDSGERKTSDPTKARKDAIQFIALVNFFLERNPVLLVDAYLHVVNRGTGWKKRVAQGIAVLDQLGPHLHLADRLAAAVAQVDEQEEPAAFPSAQMSP